VEWPELDRRERCDDLNGKSKVMTWKCQQPRMVRLRQIGTKC
jgi:hypothetical protein